MSVTCSGTRYVCGLLVQLLIIWLFGIYSPDQSMPCSPCKWNPSSGVVGFNYCTPYSEMGLKRTEAGTIGIHCLWKRFCCLRPQKQNSDQNICIKLSPSNANKKASKVSIQVKYWLLLHRMILVWSGNIHFFKETYYSIIFFCYCCRKRKLINRMNSPHILLFWTLYSPMGIDFLTYKVRSFNKI